MTNPSSPPSPNSSAPKTPAGESLPTDATTSPPKTRKTKNRSGRKRPSKSTTAKAAKTGTKTPAIIRRIKQSAENAKQVMQAFDANPVDNYHALLNTVGQIAFDESIKDTNKKANRVTVREFARLAIAGRREENATQKMRLDREKWEFDVARMCHDHLQKLQLITADQTLSEDARLHAIREQLFGPNLPK